MATFIKRRIKLRTQRKSEFYQKVTDELIFNLLFGNCSMEDSVIKFHALEQSPLLKKTITRSIISLHRSYSGEQRTILENFFVLSDLTAYSFKKMKSRYWVNVVEGIRVLSVLNVHEAFEAIKLHLNHPNNYVKKEAFIGLITLEGMEGLSDFELPDIFIDDWTQSCILYQLKIRQFDSFSGVHLLFNSENESLIVLGARIVEYFQLHPYYQAIYAINLDIYSKNLITLKAIKKRILKNLNS